ncbi:DUF3520 domain-containing protein, partial [Bacteroides sp. OttesenSCG-928-E20]|nr:DUF3520 domain-containing protein [Bacteroides sp. OttesenSCG-928-E20]
TGIESNWVGKIDELKYQKKEPKKEITNTGSKELLTIKLRYKDPNGAASKKMELPVMDNKGNNASADFRFAAAVAMFGQLLRNSDYKGDATHDKVITLAKSALGDDEQGYRREFVRLVQTVAGMAH